MIQIWKGRPRNLQSQGSIKQGNCPTIKEAIAEWMGDEKNEGVSWSEFGVLAVNSIINGHPNKSKDGKSPSEIYYAKREMLKHLMSYMKTF